MKTKLRSVFFATLIAILFGAAAQAASTYTLNPLNTFTGVNGVGDGSIKPGQSLGISPLTGNEVDISAPNVDLTGGVTNIANPNGYGFGAQPNDRTNAPNSTAGFNMRGLAYD